MKRVTLYVSGDVQRVNYRSKVIIIAETLDITGCVQNLKDGRVKIIAEGDENNLERFIEKVNIQNTLINVINIEKNYSESTGDYEGFYKLVSPGETDSRLDKAADYLKELLHVTKNGFDRLENKQDSTITELKNVSRKIEQSKIETTSEIRSLRDDLKSHFDDRLKKMEFELSDIKAKVFSIKTTSNYSPSSSPKISQTE